MAKDEAKPAKVIEVLGKTGVHGEINQVMAKILEGREEGRTKRRNVKGRVKEGDILLLKDTETEAKPINSQ